MPSIAGPVGAITTTISHDEHGRLVEPGNHQQLFEALDVMLSDMELTSRLGKAGWQTVQDRYSAISATAKYISLFQTTLGLEYKGTT